MALNYDILGESDLSKVYKQVQIAIAKYIAVDDKVLLAKLRKDISSYLLLLIGKEVVTRFDTLEISNFLEFTCSIRFAVFMAGQGLLRPTCEKFLFGQIREKEEELKMNLIALAIIVAT